ncbi:unnamed protein product [Symbiodinium sp. CCMP2592]|nr:unnamed protein product [Symbiodinium sp. CCMP2592]
MASATEARCLGRKAESESLESPLQAVQAAAVSQEPAQAALPKYRLHSFEDFRRYIIDADIKLVRPGYLRDLHKFGLLWPRRQEAERHAGALYAPTATDRFTVVTISHVWETMEHPDPCGFQLAQIVQQMDTDAVRALKTGISCNRHDVHFFIDFVSLYQYKREHQGQEDSFRKSLSSMHLFYANSDVWRIECLTPKTMWWWRLLRGSAAHVYSEEQSSTADVRLRALKRNKTAYANRGWCAAEAEWSKPGSKDISQTGYIALLFVKLRCRLLSLFFFFTGTGNELPLQPEEFRQLVQRLRFTHRSDLDSLLDLQRQVFDEKLLVEFIAIRRAYPSQVHRLLEMLPLYSRLQRFILTHTHLKPATALELLRMLTAKVTLSSLSLELPHTNLGLASVVLLAEVLVDNATLRTLNVGGSRAGDTGAAALAEALLRNRTLHELGLQFAGVGTDGALALARGLEANDTLRKLDLTINPIGPRGLRALKAAQERRGRLTINHENFGRDSSVLTVVFTILRMFLYAVLLSIRLRAWLRWQCRCCQAGSFRIFTRV